MGLDQHRAQITAEWIDTSTGEIARGRVVPADRRGVQIPAILTTIPVQGVSTDAVLVAGKMGKAYAYRADNGQPIWTQNSVSSCHRSRSQSQAL
jgi:hypothetical protein